MSTPEIPSTYRGNPRVAWWHYSDSIAVGRFDAPDCSKEYPVYTLNGSGKWTPGAPPEPRPLFGLGSLYSPGPVFIAEGEKCASALHGLGLVAVCSMGGSSAPSKADWTRLKGRECVVLPDNDEPGEKYAQVVAELLDATPRVLRLEGLPKGGDIVDWIQTRLPGWDGNAPIEGTQTPALRDELLSLLEKAPLLEAAVAEWDEPKPLPDLDPELPQFPLDALPTPLRRGVDEIARFSKVAPEGPAVAFLAAIAGAAGKGILIEEKPGLCHHPALFFLCVAEPSERKSTLLGPVREILDSRFTEARSKHQQRFADASWRNEVRTRKLEGIRKTAKRDADPAELAREAAKLQNDMEPVPPAIPLLVDDCTSQFLVRYMADHGEEAFLLSPEGRNTLDQILGRYTKNSFTDEAVYLNGISGDPIGRGRVGSNPAQPYEHVNLSKPCLNVCIFVQPDKWRSLLENGAMRDSGLVSRIAIVRMPRMAGKRIEGPNERPFDEAELEPFRAVVDHIIQGRELFSEPTTIRLSPEATEARRLFHNEIEEGISGELADHADIAGKAVTQTVKIAGVLHLAEVNDAQGNEISLDTWARAEQLGRYFLAAAIAAQNSATIAPAITAAKAILSRADELPDPFTIRDLTLKHWGGFDREAARDALEVLVDHGHLRACKRRPDGGGRPTVDFLWNPESRIKRLKTA